MDNKDWVEQSNRRGNSIKLQRTYQVIPPSYKVSDNGVTKIDYKLICEEPPTEISLCDLISDFQKKGLRFSAKNPSSGNSKYGHAALKQELKNLAITEKGHRNDQPNKSSYSLGQLIAAGYPDEDEVISELTKIALEIGLGPEEINKTIKSGLEAGKARLRVVSEEDHDIPGSGPRRIEWAFGTFVGLDGKTYWGDKPNGEKAKSTHSEHTR